MTRPARFTRVVLVLSGTAGSGVFAALAAQIARSFNAELAGLFVEDETLLTLADLPFCVEIVAAGSARPFARGDLEQAFRATSMGVRLNLEKIARAALVRFSFARERGEMRAIMDRIAGHGDIVVFVEPERAIERACLVNAASLAAALASRGSLFYVPVGARAWTGAVAAVLTGGADREVLSAALRIAASRNVAFTVATPEPGAWRALLADILAEGGIGPVPAISERRIDASGVEALLASVAAMPDELLVLAREPAALSSPEALRRFAAGRHAPVLLIEPERAAP